MDLRKSEYFGICTVNGRTILLNQNMCEHGSVMHLFGEALKSLNAERSKPDDAGAIEVVLRIRNRPIATDKESVSQLNRAIELDTMIEGSPDSTMPVLNESYEDYYRRLIEVELLPKSTAELLAAQWFDRPVNPATQQWLNDPKAQRFRELNSRDAAYDAALPDEYESLKHYVQTVFPAFVEGLTFRTA